jgi:hypothetical protein
MQDSFMTSAKILGYRELGAFWPAEPSQLEHQALPNGRRTAILSHILNSPEQYGNSCFATVMH